ncbi:MAG TPA: HAD-IIA family hydrolase [Propionibacteriaceae bacterium]
MTDPPAGTQSGSGSAALVDRYDAALFDLDGVVYLGPAPVPGAVEGIARLRERGVKLGFITNNAARRPEGVADHLRRLGIAAGADDVVTSSQAAAQLLVTQFGPGTKVLVVGGEGILTALNEVGLTGVHSADADPQAVIQGFSFDLTWDQLNEAAIAIQRGAHWVATNTDSTRPTDRGVVPGNGAAVNAVRMAVDVDPEVAGKPYRPLFDATMVRLGSRRPVYVGDRIDTDIAGAAQVGIDSLFVLSGAHGSQELLAAGPGERPTHLGLNLAALLDPERVVRASADRVVCGAMEAVVTSNAIVLETTPGNAEQGLDALWAVTQLHWRAVDRSEPRSSAAAMKALGRLGQ